MQCASKFEPVHDDCRKGSLWKGDLWRVVDGNGLLKRMVPIDASFIGNKHVDARAMT